MKVLVATKETQGNRKNDFSWATEGELVNFPSLVCDRESVDGKCGCKRSMCGVESLKATTTIRVSDEDMSEADLKEALLKMLKKSGWAKHMKKAELESSITADATELIKLANSFHIDDVLEIRGSKFSCRKLGDIDPKKEVLLKVESRATGKRKGYLMVVPRAKFVAYIARPLILAEGPKIYLLGSGDVSKPDCPKTLLYTVVS